MSQEVRHFIRATVFILEQSFKESKLEFVTAREAVSVEGFILRDEFIPL